jgi:hypothetical protein
MGCGARSALDAEAGREPSLADGAGGLDASRIVVGGSGGSALDAGSADPESDATTGSGGRETCAATFPRDGRDLQKLIQAQTAPVTICVEAGSFDVGNVFLRDGISLRGLGDSSILRGALSVGRSSGLGVGIERLRIEGPIGSREAVKLDLVDVTLKNVSGPAVELLLDGEGRLSVHLDRVITSSPGIFAQHSVGSQAIDDAIIVERSTCADGADCYDLVQVNIATAGRAVLPTGSRAHIDIRNNVVRHRILEAIMVSVGPFAPEDAGLAEILVRHNTIVGQDLDYGIVSYAAGTPLVVANNAVDGLAHGISVPPGAVIVGNAVSATWDATWFTGAVASPPSPPTGDLTPTDKSPLVGAGVAQYGVPDDFDGRPRRGHYDAGALQR